ncbi:MAG: undecaprenyl-diphosphate phosphatase [Verrucomicrobiales bacterium]|nr:undecaprenyl-diphosphate phosphatase [Verrucomicrobiae bacterium]
MTPIQAIILGIIEGLTEYLPVSSTGHLVVAMRLMGLGLADDKAASDAFSIAIQGGAIVAVLGLYYPRVIQMIRGLLGKDKVGKRLVIAMICGFLPAAVFGLLLNDLIKQYLFGITPIVVAWIVGGIAIIAVAARRKNTDSREGIDLAEITWKMAFIIGFAQCVAMWPGTSRSLMTIVGGVLVGLSLRSAVEFSFLLGVLTLGAATAKDTVEHGQLMWDTFGPLNLGLGAVFAFVSAAIAVKWMVSYLNQHGMAIFGWYRIAIGAVVGSLLAFNVISG